MTIAALPWLADTPIPALAAALDGWAAPTSDAVAALVRPLLADARWLGALIGRFAAEARRDPDFEPPLAVVRSPMQDGLLLYGDRHVAILATIGWRDRLAAKRLDDRVGSIVFTGERTLTRVLGRGGATLSLWHGGWHDGDIAPRCRRAGRTRLDDDALLEIDGRTTAYVIDHAPSDLVLLQAVVSAGAAPTLCEYDGTSQALIATGAAREETSRLQMLVTLLAETGQCDRQAFDAASRVPEAYARWHAMRAWTALDASGAARRLREIAARDPDTELRGLATRTLDLIACPA